MLGRTLKSASSAFSAGCMRYVGSQAASFANVGSRRCLTTFGGKSAASSLVTQTQGIAAQALMTQGRFASCLQVPNYPAVSAQPSEATPSSVRIPPVLLHTQNVDTIEFSAASASIATEFALECPSTAVNLVEEDEWLASSVLKKRRKKMNKHKLRKRRRRDRKYSD
mmetsp:Transcript_26180/g.62220  ORF Transcript_26180/g.62220 Transcript_26180/m.62220 type:complete len:167 (-) Transcript_26180:192-692(-)|eukprot:CAMPEP_0177714384 /NCGR_PEP_ID=MMETSP0484_2-20121128/13432_1 /TAXON_ID=354590 /ORGANISM="Rhodomonas lens, Strain RHODO" /LENGTH=166 /DNA_ID=CAMNT_0019226313 /DNA_START=136 /DNA_END=636 /DNA_ORIENTATION=+